MKKLLIGLLAIGSFTAFAEELVLTHSCEGIDNRGNQISVLVSTRMKDGVAVTSYAGPLYVVEVEANRLTAYKSSVVHTSFDGFLKKFSDGSGQFSLTFIKNENLDASGTQKARLYLNPYNSLGAPIGPVYNTLGMTCLKH